MHEGQYRHTTITLQAWHRDIERQAVSVRVLKLWCWERLLNEPLLKLTTVEWYSSKWPSSDDQLAKVERLFGGRKLEKTCRIQGVEIGV